MPRLRIKSQRDVEVQLPESHQPSAALGLLDERTVKYHLSKVYTKLSITSREQLEHVLPAAPAAGGPL